MDNVRRDSMVKRDLAKLGWQVVIVWECRVNEVEVKNKIINRLKGC